MSEDTGGRRKALDVIEGLLNALHTTVSNYPPGAKRSPDSIETLIRGTAFFPGGAGLWRGTEAFGRMPEYFPEKPVMFLGHNFDSFKAFEESKARGGKGNSEFWRRMRTIVDCASLEPEGCFFTNALMGIKEGSATGPMPRDKDYRHQCLEFLKTQVKIVQPKAVVSLGDTAARLAKKAEIPSVIEIRHPSNWDFRASATRNGELRKEGLKIQSYLTSLRSS